MASPVPIDLKILKGQDGRLRASLLAAIVVLLICCIAAFDLYRSFSAASEERDLAIAIAASMPDQGAAAEKREIDALEKRYAAMNDAAQSAIQGALLAEASGRLPISVHAPAAQQVAIVVIDEEIVPDEPPPPEPEPPRVEVRAVLIPEGGRSSAVIDVEGGEISHVVERGKRFMYGEAIVTKIDGSGVTFSWNGKTYTAGIAR